MESIFWAVLKREKNTKRLTKQGTEISGSYGKN
jgi:hypothetical protein